MSDNRWTPGPWCLAYDDQAVIGTVNGADGQRLAYAAAVRLPRGDGTALANARLIAAAPELYEALEAINRCASPDPERTFDGVLRDLMLITDIARAALAKARGETP